mgnify:CR=1 FL=1
MSFRKLTSITFIIAVALCALSCKANDKGESYVDVVFAIDSNGYVICEDYKTTGNQINRFLTKLLG